MENYKMTNVSSRKKNFKTLEQLEKYVKDKNIITSDLSSEIKIEKTVTTTTTTIKVKIDKADKEHVILFLEKMISDIKSGVDVYSADVGMFYSRWFKDAIKNNGLEKISEFLPKRKSKPRHGTLFYLNEYELPKFSIKILQYIIDNYDNINFNMRHYITDFKASDTYGFETEQFVIMRRKRDILINDYAVVGRNVNYTGSRYLTNDDIKKLL